ncbi:MAG: hypothetical protein MK212_00115 [Saprospiraceae bacterium]|nr:hypothetical protein [Saprospiraceae bacterium]
MMEGNPIWFNDPLGDSITPNSVAEVNNFRTFVNGRITTTQQQIRTINNQINAVSTQLNQLPNGGFTNPNAIMQRRSLNLRLNQLNSQRNDRQRDLTELQTALAELNTLVTSTSPIFYEMSPQAQPGINRIVYNNSTNRIEIKYFQGNRGLQGHELHHAFQFDQGELDFGPPAANSLTPNIWGGGNLYDISDEVSAYQRGYALGRRLFNSYQDINTNNISNMPRYNGLPAGPLSVRTSGADVERALGRQLTRNRVIWNNTYSNQPIRQFIQDVNNVQNNNYSRIR